MSFKSTEEVREAHLVELQEDPLRPLVVVGGGGTNFPAQYVV